MLVERARRFGRENLVQHLDFPEAGHALFAVDAAAELKQPIPFEEAVKEKEPEEADADLGGDDIDEDLENVDEGEDSPDNDIDLGGDDDLGVPGADDGEDDDH